MAVGPRAKRSLPCEARGKHRDEAPLRLSTSTARHIVDRRSRAQRVCLMALSKNATSKNASNNVAAIVDAEQASTDRMPAKMHVLQHPASPQSDDSSEAELSPLARPAGPGARWVVPPRSFGTQPPPPLLTGPSLASLIAKVKAPRGASSILCWSQAEPPFEARAAKRRSSS